MPPELVMPSIVVPPLACDCHMHIFGPVEQYPAAATRGYTPTPAALPAYLAMAGGLGLQRVVFVQPSAYGTDNSCMLDALRAQGDASPGGRKPGGRQPGGRQPGGRGDRRGHQRRRVARHGGARRARDPAQPGQQRRARCRRRHRHAGGGGTAGGTARLARADLRRPGAAGRTGAGVRQFAGPRRDRPHGPSARRRRVAAAGGSTDCCGCWRTACAG